MDRQKTAERSEKTVKIFQTWQRNSPSSVDGDSITVKITYSSFDQSEIDELEKKMSTWIAEVKNAGNNADQVQVSGL